MAPDEFWDQTMISYRIRLAGVAARLDREHEGRQWLAHSTASLIRMTKLPSLEELRGGGVPVVKKQTPSEMRAVFASMREVAGG